MRQGILLAAVLMLATACARVPLTGRKQTKLLPESSLSAASLDVYRDFLASNTVLRSGEDAEMVRRVGTRLAAAVEDILRVEGMIDRISELDWEFNLVQDPLANAWAMPGGKVVIYTGILPLTQSEAGLAVVMGHELAHAVARHGNERMSQMMLAEVGMVALDIATSQEPEQTRQWLMLAAGMGSQLGVMLPFSRLHESEADELGLIFMAHAGYDPAEAVPFWTRMSHASAGASPPEFLSTHPSHNSRIENIQTKYLPVARTYYEKAKQSKP
jgi:predicted Zn-dependent protease